jgi:hypothetical protein
MDYDALAKQYGGSAASNNLDELAKQYGGLALDKGIKSLVPKERTWGEAATDIAASVGSGIGKTMQVPGQLYGLITGDMETPQGPSQNTEEAKKALVRGAGNAVMPGMTGIQGLGKRLEEFSESKKSDVLKAKEEERNRIIQEAESKGLWEQAKAAGAATITDPALLTNFLAEMAPNMVPVGAAARLGRGAVLAGQIAKGVGREAAEVAAQKAGTRAALGTGAVMQGADVGTDTYEEAYKELIARDVPPEEAKQRALNLARASGLSAAAVSLLAQKLPGAQRLEKTFAGTKGTAGRAIGAIKTGLGESYSEGFEEAGGVFGKNLAMREVNPEQSLTKGVGTAGALGAIGGLGVGSVTGALQKQEAPTKPEEPQVEAPPTTFKSVEPLRIGYNPTVEDVVEKDPLQNPVGNFMPNELTPEIIKFVNDRRKEEGKSKLKAFSIEDLVESGAPPQDIDRMLAYKNRFDGKDTFTPDQVIEQAQLKNIDTETKGFTDFLRRSTGQENLADMSQPKLHSAFVALQSLPESPELQVLPEGTNATRFTDAQYNKSLRGLEIVIGERPAIGRTSVIQEIKDFTGLENDHDANALLRTAIRNGDLESTRIPQFEIVNDEGKVQYVSNNKESAKRSADKLGFTVRDGFREEIGFPGESTQLPGGPDIRMGTFKEGDRPEGYEIKVPSITKPLTVAKTETEANALAEEYAGFREDKAKELQKEVDVLEKKIFDDQKQLKRMEALGGGHSVEFSQLAGSINANNQKHQVELKEKQKELAIFQEPLHVVPTKSVTPLVREGFTFFDNGAAVASFPTKQQAEEFALGRLDDEKLTNIVNIGPTLKGLMPKRLAKMAEAELGLRGRTEPGIEVKFKGTEEEARERLAKLGIFSGAVQNKVKELEKVLLPALRKLGLERVGLNIVRDIENNAEGNYAAGVIKIALDNEPGSHLGVLRHESLHALKELGAFTDKEWAVLNKQAKEKWVPQYMKDRTTEYKGKQVPLYDAYQDIYQKKNKNLDGFDEYIQEEAIAEAFRYFKPQAGVFGNIGYRLAKFFTALKNAFKGLGFQTADSVFEKIEAGKMRPKQEAAIKEAEKFSLKTISSLNTAFNIAKGHNFEKNKELKEVIQALVNFRAEKEGIDLKTYSDETKKHLVEVGLADAIRSLKSNASAVGWYDRKVNQALAIVSLIHSEIATDPNAKFAFTWALAVTSNGQKVDQNFELAEKVYKYYKRYGKMPTNIKAGQAQGAINKSLKLFNEMEKDYGLDLLRSFMATEFTASQIEKATGIKVTGEFKDTKVLGAAILGPKIGNGFFSNLNGIFDRLTMDRWLMRTWGRYTGTLVEINQPMIEKKREELKGDVAKLLKDKVATDEISKLLKQEIAPIESDEQADALAIAIQKTSMLPENRKVLNKTDAGESIRKSGNALFKYLDGQKEAPNGPAERDAIRDVFKDILKGLHNQGYQDMTMSDLQALLWYPEKRLYDIAKDSNIEEDYTTEEAPDYANAAAKLARSKKVSNAKIQAEIKKVDEDYDNRAAAAKRGIGDGTGQPSAQGRVAPLNRKEYKRFLTRGILQSYRERNEKASGPYVRDSGKNGKGIRVLEVVAKAKYNPKTAFKNVMQEAGASVPALYELQPQDADIFQDAIQASKNKNDYGAAVTVYPESEYAKMRLFIAEDGKAGFALKGDDIVSVFAEAPHVGASAPMLQLAVQEGGRKLDAFDTVLPDLYFNAGFKIVSRTEFNEEYQPDGWSKQTFKQFNNGKPDVVFMVFDPNNTEVPSPTAGRLYEDYDEAVKAQDAATKDYKFPVKPTTEEKVYKEKKSEEGKYSLRANPTQTETPEFKQWFGKSKIVTEYDKSPVSGNDIMDWMGIPEKTQSKYWQKLEDEERAKLTKDYRNRNGAGQPKVMYHGTARDITAFRPKQANAIFVTDNPDFASVFSGMSEGYMLKEFVNKMTNEDKKDFLLKVLKENKKQFDKEDYNFILESINTSQNLYTSTNLLSEVGYIDKKFYIDVRKEIGRNLGSGQNIMPLYVRSENPFDYENPEHVKKLIEKIKTKDKAFVRNRTQDLEDGDWATIEHPIAQKAIKDLGHDGFYVFEANEKNLAVYEPSQLKSAIGNIGTFDINNPDIRYSIRANLPAATNARIDATTGQRKTEGFMDRILSILNPETRAKLRAGLVFQFEALERGTKARAAKYGNNEYMADVSATAAALESMRAKQIVAAAMRDGVPVYRNGFTTTDNLNGTQKGLLDIFSPLAATGDPDVWRCFQFYAGSKRGARLDAEGREHLFTPSDVQAANAMAAQFKQNGIDFDAVYKEYQKWNGALVKYMKDTGVLSAADAAYFTKFGDYIPFYRQVDGESTVGPKIFSSIAGVQKPKALKGGTEKLGDFLENVIRNASAAVESGMKNVAANRGIRDALDLGTARQVNVQNQDTVSVKENGVTKFYELDDPLLFEAFKGLNVPRMPWLQVLAKPADILRNFVTKDPGFILANIMRDSVSAWVTSGSDMKPVIDSFKQFGKILANQSPEAVAMAKAGLGGYEFKGSLKDSADAFEKALRAKTGTRTKTEQALLPFTKLWEMLEQGSNASDMATRAEIYKRVLAETGNEAEALFQASEVMNFSRKGNFAVMQVLTAVVPFMNARIQGLDVLYRSGFGQAANVNKERIQKAFIVRSMAILGMTAAYWAMVHDDDEYKRLTKEERDGYWIVPGLTFNDKPFRFPIPFEIGVVFKVFPERILEYTMGQDTEKDFRESITRNIVDTLKFNPIPQALIPIYENISNHSFFTGEKIVGRGLEDVAKPLQYTASTSLFSRELGEATGMSPIQIDNVIRGYTGTMGMYAVNMLDSFFSTQGDPVKATTRAEQLPVIKRFFASDSGTVAQYYDLKDEVDEVVRTVNFLSLNDPEKLEGYLKDNGNTYMLKDFVSSIEKDMKQIREYRNAVNADRNMSGDEKRSILDELHKYEIVLTSDIKAIRKEFH